MVRWLPKVDKNRQQFSLFLYLCNCVADTLPAVFQRESGECIPSHGPLGKGPKRGYTTLPMTPGEEDGLSFGSGNYNLIKPL